MESPLDHPQVPLGIVWKIGSGDPLSPDEQVAWDDYQAACAEQEASRDLLGIVDLGEVMRSGSTDPEMLIDDLLVRALHHLWFGRKESAKTWIALYAVACMIAKGQTVVWVDKEMGRRDIADRLKTFRAPSHLVDEHLVYCEYPVLDGSKPSRELWVAMLRSLQPALIVVDAQTEVLADAGLNENLGTDIAKWMEMYLSPARRLGTTTIMLDHTGHSEQGRAAASRQKGAAAKVELAFEVVDKFDRETVGKLKLTLEKNSVSAPIPEVQWWRIGGSPFVLEPDALPASDAGDGGAAWEIRMAIEALLRDRAGERLTSNQIQGMVAGRAVTKRRVLGELAHDELSDVQVEPSGQSLKYWIEASENRAASTRGASGTPPVVDSVGNGARTQLDSVDSVAPKPAKEKGSTESTKPGRSGRRAESTTESTKPKKKASPDSVERSRKDRRNGQARARRAAAKGGA